MSDKPPISLKWNRVRGRKTRPQEYETVLLHTPQWGETLGAVVTGIWTGTEWHASDDRDFEDSPPVHWAYVGPLPAYQGSKADWQFLEEGELA